MKNLLIDILVIPLALATHLWLKFDDWRIKRAREKRIDKFFKENQQLARWNCE